MTLLSPSLGASGFEGKGISFNGGNGLRLFVKHSEAKFLGLIEKVRVPG